MKTVGLAAMRAQEEADRFDPVGGEVWDTMRVEAFRVMSSQKPLRAFMNTAILAQEDFASALTGHLARKLADQYLSAERLEDIIREAAANDPRLMEMGVSDLTATCLRDPAADGYLTPFLYYKGYHALQWHRVGHWLWNNGRQDIARFLQNRMSEVFAVDIHPAVPVGRGVFIDHATGIVIGETAVIGDDVSILQNVTLGGTGKEHGDRHPKIGDGVLLAAGAKVLGNIKIGTRAKVAAGSVVLKDVPACATVAGVPAKVVTWCKETAAAPGLTMDQSLPEPEYAI